ncbi:MAG: hypothetical protein QOG15_732 [Solirubrobacteraceae bacterium]|jgi:SAM-dependent methyltransferase|nr:hypothetical protein [Solirubrobacteraceae bacterium]
MRPMTSTGYSAAERPRHDLVLGLLRAERPPPARVVELGAAPGEQSIQMANAGYDVTAVDIGIASDAWEGAPEGTMVERFEKAGVELVLWNLEKTPYPLRDQTFDAVLLTEVFEHLREYPITALHEARRILKPGGCLYLTTPNAAYLRNRVQLLLGRNTASSLADWIGGIPFARHAREYTFGEMRELLRQADLEPTVMTSRHLHIGSGRGSSVARAGKSLLDRIARARPSFGPAIVVVARRPA